MRAVIAGLAAFAVSACATTPDAVDIVGGTWTLVELYGEPVAADDTNRPVTLTLEADGNASGYSGCNQFGGEYTLEDDQLTFGPIAMTRMACDRGMDIESRYASMFDRSRTWVMQDGMLHLVGRDGLLARFRRN